MYDINEKRAKIYYILFFTALMFVLAVLPYFLNQLPKSQENSCKNHKVKKSVVLPFETKNNIKISFMNNILLWKKNY